MWVPMRPWPAQVVPEHGVFGEEHGVKRGSGAGADYMWVLDPIDGTKSFITGGRCVGGCVRGPEGHVASGCCEVRGAVGMGA